MEAEFDRMWETLQILQRSADADRGVMLSHILKCEENAKSTKEVIGRIEVDVEGNLRQLIETATKLDQLMADHNEVLPWIRNQARIDQEEEVLRQRRLDWWEGAKLDLLKKFLGYSVAGIALLIVFTVASLLLGKKEALAWLGNLLRVF
jgi:hypothetical protein